MVLRLADTDLKKLLKSDKHLEEVQVKSIVYDILCGLNYLHTKKIIHRDLKPANVMVTEDGLAKVLEELRDGQSTGELDAGDGRTIDRDPQLF